MKEILLAQNKVVLVDNPTFRKLRKFKWHLAKGYNTYYAVRYIRYDKYKYQKIYMHNEILNVPKGMEVDHINHNGLDNRINNLRVCTHRQNCQNRLKIKKKSSKYKGVILQHEYKSAPLIVWAAQISVNGKLKRLGAFTNEKSAAEEYNKAAKYFFGEYACLNKI